MEPTLGATIVPMLPLQRGGFHGFTDVAFPTTVNYSRVEPEQALIWSVLHLPRNVIIDMSEHCLTLWRLYCIQFKPLDFHCTMRHFHMLYKSKYYFTVLLLNKRSQYGVCNLYCTE
jgi:hypothetical protein